MKKRREPTEVEFCIKRDMKEFNKQVFLDDVKFDILNIYDLLKNEKLDKIKQIYTSFMVDKIMNQKHKYRITKDIDHISVQYVELSDYIVENEGKYIKIYLSVYFYDNTENNMLQGQNDKYWNDIWYVTYKYSNIEKNNNGNCYNCGATMEYNKETDLFKCKYCKSIRRNVNQENWKILDIEVK